MLAKSDWPTDSGERFWESYPRRIAKKAAMVALERVRKSGEVPFEILISAVGVYARSVVGKDMQYVKHPTTWLNQGCWDDAPEALLKGAVQPSAMTLRPGVVLIRRGSPQARAWEAHRGRSIPWGREGVWQMESEWPPGHAK